MPTDRLDDLFGDIHTTLDQMKRQLRQMKRQLHQVVCLLLYILTLSVIIGTKVFFP